MTDQPGPDQRQQLTEEEVRALEAEIDRLNVDDVILQTVVSLINLGARKGAVGAPPEAGLQPDYDQLRIAIEAARALLGVVEPRHGAQLGPIREAISQLQMAYARGTGAGAQPAPPPQGGQDPAPQGGQAGESPGEGGGGPAQKSGRLWVPGQ